jgi:hypothetical protein
MPEVKKPLGIRGCKWEENIKIDFKEIGERINLILLSQFRKRLLAPARTITDFLVP